MGSDAALRKRMLWHMLELSGHTPVRTLAKYARVSHEGLRRYQAGTDPAARR
ncbi:hypothetical protein [Nocardia australiensis]|uniref:hypothetical protein n=1 Tax=Nocardia australiensis TaxID=2887191 RepID=UPI001D158D60|nr:hypothetical protein [Nocardia australiensis]